MTRRFPLPFASNSLTFSDKGVVFNFQVGGDQRERDRKRAQARADKNKKKGPADGLSAAQRKQRY